MLYLSYGKWGSSGSENRQFFQILRGIRVPPRMNSNSGHPSGSAGTKFYREKVLLKSSTPKQLPMFGLGLGSQSEKRIQISSFLELPDAENYFPRSSEILLSRGIPNFYGRRTFSSSQFRIWSSISFWQFIPILESKLATWRNSMAKFSVPRSGVVLISKFKFQNFSCLRSASSQDPASKI